MVQKATMQDVQNSGDNSAAGGGSSQTARLILDIISEYALNKFDNAKEQQQGGAAHFLAIIGWSIEAGTPVETCLPAFPFKSANKVYKVLGSLPDKAEELALDRLNTMCNRIQEIYAAGARVTIISDGITYNDLLCISDQETWAYGEAQRKMAVQKQFDNIGFSRMRDLLEVPQLKKMREITYVANCTNFRRLLLNKYGRDDLDIDQEIASNSDTKLTYLGYKRFLESDLKHIFPRGADRTANDYRCDCKYLAKQMLIRGYAAFPHHLRLSIHESICGTKVSISLLNTRTGFTTPWHCSVAQLADGTWISAPMGEFAKDDRLELVFSDDDVGRPSHFREKQRAGDAPGIGELSASYLQPARPLSASTYLSGALTPQQESPSSSTASLSSPSQSDCQSSTGSPPSCAYLLLADADAETTASPPYGRRLIPQIMDSLAAAEPDRVVFSLTTIASDTLQYQPVTARKFAQAVDKTAWWLQGQVGKPDSIQALGYIGPHDLRHILLTYACVKVGYAHRRRAGRAGGNRMQRLGECRRHHPGFSGPRPAGKAADEGSAHATMDAVRLLPPVDGCDGLLPWTTDWKVGDRIYSAFPMSHGAGMIMNVLMPALFRLHCILGPKGVLPNMGLVERLAETTTIDIWSLVPSLVDELGETASVLTKLRPSKFICASGGPVSPVSAGKVNQVVRVLNLTGTTEGLFIGNLVPPREDWFWFCFHPHAGFEFRELELEPDTFEHWVHRNAYWPLFQGIFHTFPDLQSINLKVLYVRHPGKPNLWAFKGRSDDLVVLSSGYKISPLDTEALVTTHPAVRGCLVFGTGRPQAGLLIELHDGSDQTDHRLLDSLWETVRQANSQSRHQNQLLRDFVTIAEPDKPFFRTDKGTVKRSATLALYADYIERFYHSRSDDHIVGPDVAVDANLFDLGLDSLGVFSAAKTLRTATGLTDKIAPRHLYANPTLERLTAAVQILLARTEEVATSQAAARPFASMEALVRQHKARQSFRLNALDYVNPNHGMGLVFYLPLKPGVGFRQAFDHLQAGLNRTLDMIPALGGKVMRCSEQEIGFVQDDLCVTIPPLAMASLVHNRLVCRDLSDVLPSFVHLRDHGFAPSAFHDSLVLRDDPFPQLPADIFVGQANFVHGGCLLAVDINHCCLNGLGVMVAIKAWAENCRFLQGDQAANCSWYDPESFNHSLPEIIHEHEGWSRPLSDIDPETWAFLPFCPPDDRLPRSAFQLHSVWPPPPADRPLRTTLFMIRPEKLAQMKRDVLADQAAQGIATPASSISDIVQAFFWRAAIRVRYRIATEAHGRSFGPDDVSILELPSDGRPYFSSLLPSTYMGSLLLLNHSSMPVEQLCAPNTTIGRVALLLRQAATRITPSLVHDVFSLLQSLPDHPRFSTANMGLDHMHAMISNLMLFPMDDICFGDSLFANAGSPESMRPQLERGHGRFRFLVVFPMKKDGGIELALGTHPEELDMFLADDEFTNYADLVDRAE
ncbi:transferase family protein [Grosmannia clavigera kw1407]|uniref:Transferase family protein n=1 Tax=Grosmannia clavigera (strain kw1407 / UAMH 11150) TaxID=655863 RepID=F0XA03_GROCL|nr:transferase family protein [Grosmannia clavigera kw1407]EFX05940.1 transferase family protein [Grosmannia clavigera kw1407]